MEDYLKLLAEIGFAPEEKEISLVEEALTHSSYAYEAGGKNISDNERLEFLGDAVLELVISDYLYRKYPFFPEGRLTKIRAELVCEESLAAIAAALELGKYLRLGRGEAASGGSSRPSLLADALEAFIGAIYLLEGFETAGKVIKKLFNTSFEVLDKGELRKDYKTLMQEYAQDKFSLTPSYRIVEETGPDHDKTFTAQFLLEDKVWGEGKGKSKKEAEQEAAGEAFRKLVG